MSGFAKGIVIGCGCLLVLAAAVIGWFYNAPNVKTATGESRPGLIQQMPQNEVGFVRGNIASKKDAIVAPQGIPIGASTSATTSVAAQPLLSDIATRATPEATAVSQFYELAVPSSEQATKSQQIGKLIESSISKVESALRGSEIQRSDVQQRSVGSTLRSMIKIVPPSASDLSRMRTLIEREAVNLQSTERMFFLVDAQRLLDEFTAFGNKILVVYVNERQSSDGEESGDYHSYLTDHPEQFVLEAEGRPLGVPKGATPNDSGRIVGSDGKAYFRYAHYFTRK